MSQTNPNTTQSPNWATKDPAFGVAKRHGGARGKGRRQMDIEEDDANRNELQKSLWGFLETTLRKQAGLEFC